jgi:hypothetical protein
MAASDDLAFVFVQPLRDFDAEELQHILDGVYTHHAHARPEAVWSELSSFRRIRELNESVIHRFVEDIASGRWPRVASVDLLPQHDQASLTASPTTRPR